MNPKLLAIDMRAAGAANVHPALAESSSNSKQKQLLALASDDVSSQSSLTNNQITKFNKTLLSVQSYPPQSPDGSNYTLSEDPPQQQIDPKPPSESTQLIDTFPDSKLPTASLPPGSGITKPAVLMPDTAKTENKPLITGIDLDQTKAAASVIEANGIKATYVQNSPMPPYAADSNGPKIPTTRTNCPDQLDSCPKFHSQTSSSVQLVQAAIDSDLPITQLSSSQQTQAVSSNQETSFSASDKLTGDKAATNNKDKIIPELTEGNAGKNVGVLSSDFLSYKTTVAESQILTRQPKSQNSSVANDNFNANFEQMFSHNDAQIAVAQKSSILAETDKPVNNFYFSDVSSDVAKQILESIYSSFSTDSKQITIRLNPPELGKVFIRFRQEDTNITGLLEVDKTQTKYQIEQALPQIIQNLQDSGIQIKRLEVALAQQDPQDPLPDQSTHQDWFQQHSFLGYDTSDSGKSVNLFLTNAANSQDNPTYPVQVAGDSINILV
jgi:flagellar hook-length control protein FliK